MPSLTRVLHHPFSDGWSYGNLVVHRGNIVKANENPPFVVITQIQPIYVSFSVPEQHLTDIKRHMAAGKLEVGATIPKEEALQQRHLAFVDNMVDRSTGTIRLKATFQNREKMPLARTICRCGLEAEHPANAMVVPSSAVQTGQ